MHPLTAFLTTPTVTLSKSTFSPNTTWKRPYAHVYTHRTIRACVASNETTDARSNRTSVTESGERKLSKSEEMAALMGQDVGELKQKAERQKQELVKEKKGRYLMALASVAISGILFGIQKNDPNASVNLMRYLTESSAPVEVVGMNGKPTMVEFSATWCENCKAMSKRVFELEREYGERVNFVVVDGEDPRRREMVERFGVDGVPQFSMVSKEGEVKGNLIGMVPKEALRVDLEALLEGEGLPFPGVSLEELRGIGLD